MIKKILLFLGIFIVLVVGFLAWKFYFRFLPVDPHNSIVISLPFAKEDDELIFINPMGETDHHKPPRGHPGLDFGWRHPAPLRAVADGKITKIEEHSGKGFGVMEKIYDVEVVSGIYAFRYGEIAPALGLKVGTREIQAWCFSHLAT